MAAYLSKQTLFVERDVLRSVGMWDASFRSRAPSELLLRLNPVCSILGIPMVTYELALMAGLASTIRCFDNAAPLNSSRCIGHFRRSP